MSKTPDQQDKPRKRSMALLRTLKQPSVVPGFGLTLGFTVFYLSVIVLIPMSAMVLKSTTMGWPAFWAAVSSPQVIAAYKLSFGASAVAASLNAVFGFIVAWTLVRYSFPGKRLVDAMVDLPFALPTAVSGITLATLYSPNGWFGQFLYPLGIESAYSRLGVTIALTFIGLPFVVRTLQPALQDLEAQTEEAAASLGATRWQTLWRVILPAVLPSLLTGFALAFARALGEYGSVVFIAGNKMMETEIVPLLIVSKLYQHTSSADAGAPAIATVMLVISLAILLTINLIQWRASHRKAGG